ncbi:MAG: pyruvate dehydrogenase (acetyl-transferring), homodimeric type [Acidobacteria bacterium]|nr:MAG: pyruvate dehydrogenase (acetyl-transferring), homodimeric type [Acidobacteriota bacterium]
MHDSRPDTTADPLSADWELERQEWLDALESLHRRHGAARVREIVEELKAGAVRQGIELEVAALRTPYRNTIPVGEQPHYPGDAELEERIENLVRWNAMAMVLRANDRYPGLGGHIATYASASTMLEVGFCHFFRGRDDDYGGDLVNVQAHASPGVYARAFLEGRLSEEQLGAFRRELQEGGGLSSYPHPRRMPEFWQAPTASMGLSTVSSIYQARFARYLENRGLKPRNGGRVWTFIGDGEADEPEVIGTLQIAAREKLDNLVLAINCNLQRLDGPVRGNGKIIQELEGTLRGAGWNVIKVVWGSEWDALLERDRSGVLQRRMDEALDGDYQMYSVLDGKAVREHWVRGDAELAEIMKTLSDETIRTIKRGGHDRLKVYAAFDRATRARDRPTAILFKTIKGYGLGEGAEGRNTAHQKKKMSDDERLDCARRFAVPLSREQVLDAEFYRPAEDSPELEYLRRTREQLGGFLPRREVDCPSLEPPPLELFSDLLAGSGERRISSTMALVRLLTKLLRHDGVGRYVVPIVADEARTFGMDGLFRQAGIYSPEGQRYTPVDAQTVLPYRESVDGQILQEGICEAGALASFIAAGTAYANFGVPTIPFYVFYSIFGFQRVGDLIWAAADQLCRGFLIGGTAGRTTLNGEGLQHQDGHSHLVALTVPCLQSSDAAFGYELAVIVRDGIRRMYQDGEPVFYYLTAYNENLAMPAMPEGSEEGILRGLHQVRAGAGADDESSPRVQLLGSGSILAQALAAAELLEQQGIAADVWSATSYARLYREACEAQERGEAGSSWLERCLGGVRGPFVAVSDFQRAVPDLIGRWIPGSYTVLGTDGFGLSETREVLRRHFRISAFDVALAALDGLVVEGRLDSGRADEIRRTLAEEHAAAAPDEGSDD